MLETIIKCNAIYTAFKSYQNEGRLDVNRRDTEFLGVHKMAIQS